TIGCREPHGAVRGLDDRGHSIGTQPVGAGIVPELAIAQTAEPATEGAGPDCAVTATINRIDAVLRESIGAGKRFRGDLSPLIMQMREPFALPADPQILAAASNGVNNIGSKPGFRDSLFAAVIEPVEAALHRRKPRAAFDVGIYRA